MERFPIGVNPQERHASKANSRSHGLCDRAVVECVALLFAE